MTHTHTQNIHRKHTHTHTEHTQKTHTHTQNIPRKHTHTHTQNIPRKHTHTHTHTHTHRTYLFNLVMTLCTRNTRFQDSRQIILEEKVSVATLH